MPYDMGHDDQAQTGAIIDDPSGGTGGEDTSGLAAVIDRVYADGTNVVVKWTVDYSALGFASPDTFRGTLKVTRSGSTLYTTSIKKPMDGKTATFRTTIPRSKFVDSRTHDITIIDRQTNTKDTSKYVEREPDGTIDDPSERNGDSGNNTPAQEQSFIQKNYNLIAGAAGLGLAAYALRGGN